MLKGAKYCILEHQTHNKILPCMTRGNSGGKLRSEGKLEELFGQLYDNYYQYVIRAAYLLTRDMEAAKDIVQTVFTKLWDKMQHQEIESLPSYLKQMVYNEWHLYQARASARTAHHERYGSERPPVEMPHFSESFEIRDELARVLGSLSEKQKVAMNLVYLEDRQHLEAAQIMGISRESLRTYLKRALTTVREKLTHLR